MPDEARLADLLERGWTHSHEEDRGDRRVYRPSEGDFPPARGRDSFTLAAEGSLEVGGPGPDDRPVSSTGTWRLAGNRLELSPYGASPIHLIVESVDPTRLVVRIAPDEP